MDCVRKWLPRWMRCMSRWAPNLVAGNSTELFGQRGHDARPDAWGGGHSNLGRRRGWQALRALLADVIEMVALHVDGYDTVGALRAVVAWADGKVVRGSSTWDAGRENDFDAEALALHAEAWHAAMPAFHVWGVDAAKWQDRGMLHVDALGATSSAAKEALDVLVAAGWSLEDAAKHATLRFAFGTDVLSSVATARAARALWSRLLASMGMAAGAVVRIEAQTSTLGLHAKGGRDALLGNTVSSYAAVLGGVDGLEVRGHTVRESHDDGEEAVRAERWARNIQHILREEARLGEHADAMKGSRAIEALTRQMAEQAWARRNGVGGRLRAPVRTCGRGRSGAARARAAWCLVLVRGDAGHRTPLIFVVSRLGAIATIQRIVAVGCREEAHAQVFRAWRHTGWAVRDDSAVRPASRQYAGFSGRGGARFTAGTSRQARPSVALTATRGYDSDHERVKGDVGKALAIDSIGQERLLRASRSARASA